MDYLDYREKLGIGFNNLERIKFFYTILFNMLDGLKYRKDYILINIDGYKNYCNNAGVRGRFSDYNDAFGLHYIIDSLHSTAKDSSFEVFLVRLVAFINCTNKSQYSSIKPEELKNIVEDCFSSAHLDVEFIKDKDGFFIFPRGAKELDDALVSQLLSWVEDYPLTYKKYTHVLRKYSEHLDSCSNIADDFRKTLETFFQEFFDSKKSLENLKAEYGAFLKSKGVPSEISNNLETLLLLYTNYNNNYAKHHDKAGDNVLEYIMYQTGCIIRLLITLR